MKPGLTGFSGNCVMLALLAVCSPTRMAGNGSEITNGIVTSGGVPVDSAMVIAFPAAFIPCASNRIMPETTFTDADGAFHLSLTDTAWNLLIYDRARQMGAFAGRGRGEPDMGIIILDRLGGISGTAPPFTSPASDTAYIGIRGSPFFRQIVGESSFLIEQVPAHVYEITVWMTNSHLSGEQPLPLIDSVVADAAVAPGSIAGIVLNH